MDPLNLERSQYQFYDNTYREHAPRILQYALRATAGNYEDAQDIQQQTFLVLLLKIDEPMAHENTAAYLFTVANNYIKHYLRDSRHKYDMEVSMDLLPEICDNRQAHDTGLEGDGFSFPNWVTKRDREMLALYYQEKLPLKEIGHRYGLTYGSTRTHLSRLMKRLREELKK